MEDLIIPTKTENTLSGTNTFVHAYRTLKNLKNENKDNEDVFTLIIKYKIITQADKLEPFWINLTHIITLHGLTNLLPHIL